MIGALRRKGSRAGARESGRKSGGKKNENENEKGKLTWTTAGVSAGTAGVFSPSARTTEARRGAAAAAERREARAGRAAERTAKAIVVEEIGRRWVEERKA